MNFSREELSELLRRLNRVRNMYLTCNEITRGSEAYEKAFDKFVEEASTLTEYRVKLGIDETPRILWQEMLKGWECRGLLVKLS